MNEKKFENKIRSMLTERGAWVLKTWSNGVQRSGVPDLIVCYKGYFLGLEIKATGGRASELQKWNIDGIKRAGGVGMIVYPTDWDELINLLDSL